MKTQHILNIGLNNNSFKNSQTLINYLTGNYTKYNSGIEFYKFKTDISEYEGKKESTLICYFNTTYTRLSFIVELIERLCSITDQDSIALSGDLGDLLIYRNTYSKPKQKFNKELFKV